MKRFITSFVTMALLLSLMLCALPLTASADLTQEAIEGVVADHLLEPVNPNASQEAKNLLAYLSSLTDSDQFIVGQFDISTSDLTWDNITQQFGVSPGLYSNRYVLKADVNTGVSFSNVDEANSLLEEHYNQGAVLLVHADGFEMEDYLLAVATDSSKYLNENWNMVVELDETNPDRDMGIYNGWVDYCEVYIEALRDLESRGVNAYMMRPFVEFNYRTFYGNNDEVYPSFVRVFQQFVDRWKNSGLQGWLMTYSPGGQNNTYSRYPGNDYLDVLGVTCYCEDYMVGSPPLDFYIDYDWFRLTGKPMGFTELSCRSGGGLAPRSSWFNTLQSVINQWPRISWVNCWGDSSFSLQDYGEDGLLTKGQDDGKAFMCSPFAITLDQVQNYQEGESVIPGIVQLFESKDLTGKYIGLEEKLYTEAELKALGFSVDKLGSIHVNRGFGVQFYTGDNGDGDYWGYANSIKNASGIGGGQPIRSIRVIRQRNVSLSEDAMAYASVNDDTAEKAIDGAGSRWTGDGTPAWLMIDLGKAYTINRYTVRHAGASGETANYNTRDFQFQYSMDEENWITLDTVTGNTANITDRSVTPFTAQYVRLYITAANSVSGQESTVNTIAEFELYGVDAGKAYVATESDSTPDSDKETDADTETDTDTETDADTETEVDTDTDTDTETTETEVDAETGVDTETVSDVDVDYTDDQGDDYFDDDSQPADEDDSDEPLPEDEDESDEKEEGGRRKVVRVIRSVGLPTWAIVLIVVGGVLVIGGGITAVILVRRKKKTVPPQE